MIYYIIGIRRSGIHAISIWLMGMMKQYIYLNNYELGKLTEKEIIIQGDFNVIIGLENKQMDQIEKYCLNGIKLFIDRNLEDVLNSQKDWYLKAGLNEIEIESRLNIARELYSEYPHDEGVIKYELWNNNQIYRRGIAQLLNLPFSDENKTKISEYGQSSYDSDQL